MSFWMCS